MSVCSWGRQKWMQLQVRRRSYLPNARLSLIDKNVYPSSRSSAQKTNKELHYLLSTWEMMFSRGMLIGRGAPPQELTGPSPLRTNMKNQVLATLDLKTLDVFATWILFSSNCIWSRHSESSCLKFGIKMRPLSPKQRMFSTKSNESSQVSNI